MIITPCGKRTNIASIDNNNSQKYGGAVKYDK